MVEQLANVEFIDEEDDLPVRERPKRQRQEMIAGEGDEEMERGGAAIAQEIWQQEQEDENPTRDRVRRLLAAKRKQRRLGAEANMERIQAQVQEVKDFLKMDAEEQDAFLAVYEEDGASEHIAKGLTRATSLALKLALQKTIPSNQSDFDTIHQCIELPAIQDSIADMWELAEIANYADLKPIRVVANLGHILNSLVSNGMLAYQAVMKVKNQRSTINRQNQFKPQDAVNQGNGDTQTSDPTIETI